jgi:hypothetical protein
MTIALFNVVDGNVEFYMLTKERDLEEEHRAHGIVAREDGVWAVTKNRFDLPNDDIISALGDQLEQVLSELE